MWYRFFGTLGNGGEICSFVGPDSLKPWVNRSPGKAAVQHCFCANFSVQSYVYCPFTVLLVSTS